MPDPRDSKGQRRAELMHAEQLLQQISGNLRAAVSERFEAEAAPHLNLLLERVRREIALLPRPS